MAKSYSEKLRDPRWQKKRLGILERDGWSCKICGDDKEMLVVHHRYYLKGKEPWDYPGNLLVTLCQNCHETEHEYDGFCDDFIKILKSIGFFNNDIILLAAAFLSANFNYPHDVTSSALAHCLKSKRCMRFVYEQYFNHISKVKK